MKETTTENNQDWQEAEKLDLVLDAALANTAHKKSDRNEQVTGSISRVLYFDHDISRFTIKNPLNDEEMVLVSRATVQIDKSTIGKEVLVMFDAGNVSKPIITGIIEPISLSPENDSTASQSQSKTVSLDDEKLVLSADKQIVLKCGESSITMTKEGKVLIRGKFLSSRSSGVNRIKGGSVSIN